MIFDLKFTYIQRLEIDYIVRFKYILSEFGFIDENLGYFQLYFSRHTLDSPALHLGRTTSHSTNI